MQIIEGFARARTLLSREIPADLNLISPSLEQGIKAVFGKDLTVEQAVKQIIGDVRSKGDAALTDYTLRIDSIKLVSLEINPSLVKSARQSLDRDLLAALELSANGRTLTYTYDPHKTRTGINELLQTIRDAGLLIKDVHTIKTSLEEIFVNLVKTKA